MPALAPSGSRGPRDGQEPPGSSNHGRKAEEKTPGVIYSLQAAQSRPAGKRVPLVEKLIHTSSFFFVVVVLFS